MSARGIRTIPRRALNPRAIPLPGVNRAHCAHSLSMSPEGYSRRTSLSRFPLNIKRSLSPVREDGQWKSSVYFECHYFDVSLNPATGLPFWTAKSHVDLDGTAKKINGKWLLTKVSSASVGIPIP